MILQSGIAKCLFFGWSVPVPGGAVHHLPDGHGPAVFHASVNPLFRINPPRGAWEPELKDVAKLIRYEDPPPSFGVTLKSRAICARSLPTLLVAYRRTAPPLLQSRTHTSGPIRRVPVRWSMRAQLGCTLPPRPGAAELYTFNQKIQSWLLRRPGGVGAIYLSLCLFKAAQQVLQLNLWL